MQPIPFTLTNEAITVIIDGTPKVLHVGTAQYEAVKAEIIKVRPDWDKVRKSLTQGGAVQSWLDASGVKGFASGPEGMTFNGQAVPNEFRERAAKMAAAGEDPSPLLRFFARLQQNPSKRSTDQLYTFLKHLNIPIEKDGTFLAYKSVRSDLMDVHSGTIHNKPGKTIVMPRNQISDDPNEACHEGLHVGAMAYVRSFHTGGTIIIVRVKPENVVCIPYDSNAEKMRVCEYEVVGYHTQPLPSTTVTREEVGVDPDDEENEMEVDENPSSSTYGEPIDISLSGETAVKAKKGRSAPAPTARLAKLKSRELLDESIDSLRAYAKSLKIVGASKLPGGKVALVKVIEKARRHK